MAYILLEIYSEHTQISCKNISIKICCHSFLLKTDAKVNGSRIVVVFIKTGRILREHTYPLKIVSDASFLSVFKTKMNCCVIITDILRENR